MRKAPLIVLLSVVILAIVSAPFIFGMLAEKQIKQFVQTINPSSDIKVALQSYKRGWFKSDVTFTIQVNSSQVHRLVNQFTQHPLDPKMETIVLNGKTTIFHGPIIFNRQMSQNHGIAFGKAALVFDAVLSPESRKVLMDTFTGTFPTILGTANVGFRNNITITLMNDSSLNLQQKNTDNAVHFSGFKGKWNISLNDKFIDGSYEVNGFGLSGNGMTVNVDNFVASYQGEGEIFNLTPHLGIMDETIKVPHAVVQQNQKTIFEFTNGKLFNQSVLNNNQYDVTQIIEVDKATFNDKTYGPGRYIVVFKHIDPATANQFIKQLSTLKTASAKEKDYLALASISTFSQLFVKGAELELSLDVLTPEGPVAVRSQAIFNKEQAATAVTQLANAANIQSAFNFIKKLKLNFELKLPIALTEKVFTSINEQYMEHQKAVAQKEKEATPATSQAENSSSAAMAEKSDEEIKQLAQQNTKQQLLELVNRGSLIENNGSYQLTIELKDGQLLVNGKNIQNNPQTEPGVTPVQNAQPSPSTTPIMLLAPDAVKSSNTEQPSTSTTTMTTTPIPSTPSANQVIQKEVTTTTVKKTPVAQ